jgi:hypothetical protein
MSTDSENYRVSFVLITTLMRVGKERNPQRLSQAQSRISGFQCLSTMNIAPCGMAANDSDFNAW